MAFSKPALTMGAGIALILGSILLRAAFGATASQAFSGPLVTVVWVATIGPFLGGLYVLVLEPGCVSPVGREEANTIQGVQMRAVSVSCI